MSDYARGRDVEIRLIQTNDAGQSEILVIGSPKSATFSPNDTVERDPRLGVIQSPIVKDTDGMDFTMVFYRDNHVLQELQQREFNARRNRERTPEYRILRTVFVPEVGTSKTLLYEKVKFSFSESISGRADAKEITIEGMCHLPTEV